MGILHLQWAKTLRSAGNVLGRKGMSERVIELVADFTSSPDYSQQYKGAIELAGKLSAIAQAARSDGYWDEKCRDGFHSELSHMTRVARQAAEEKKG